MSGRTVILIKAHSRMVRNTVEASGKGQHRTQLIRMKVSIRMI